MTKQTLDNNPQANPCIKLRSTLRDTDAQAIRNIVASTGFFASHEIDIAVELVDARRTQGEASGYYFLFADSADRPVGYSCYGPIGCTVGSYDLYWIAVESAYRGHGLGRQLLLETERCIARAGGRRIYVETSSRPLYDPTRRFYENNGYRGEALLSDFYSPGDGKVIYVKILDAPGASNPPA